MANTRFTDGPSASDGTKANGKQQLIDWGMEWPILKKEPHYQHSAIVYKTNN